MSEPMSTAGRTVPPGDKPDTGGGLHPPHTAQAVDLFPRTVRVPLVLLSDELWLRLRRLAYQCAAFGNALLSAQYVRAKGYGEGLDRVAYKEAAETLSSAVRDAVSRECLGLWRRLGRKILRGEQTLARFSVHRSLVIRDRGVRLVRREDGTLIVRLRIEPRDCGPVDDDPTPPLELPVWMPAVRRDAWLRAKLDGLVEREAIKKATIEFERPGRKVFVRLTYAVPSGPPRGGCQATIGPMLDGALWLRSEHLALSMTDRVDRFRAMKLHYDGIHRRLRQRLSKRGRLKDYRRALLKAGSFEAWAEGPLHQWSRQIVTWCQQAGVSSLMWSILADGTLPWERLAAMTQYKCQDAGVAFSQVVAAESTTDELRADREAASSQTIETPETLKRSPRRSRTGRGRERSEGR